MDIVVEHLGKKFNHNWIFRHINTIFDSGSKNAVVGNNGSGKTTLLKILAGVTPLTEGKVTYKNKGQTFSDNLFFKHLVLVGPYTELIEEFTLQELFIFYAKFKKLNVSFNELLQITGFQNVKKLQIKNFSSGMKQKLKLALAFYSQVSLVLLDEPTSNLDKNNINWYLNLVEKVMENKTLIISSNQEYEYSFCQNVLDVNMYK